ncbi:MAG TPA: single-stranded DNA-binding protein [Candidatus Egerieousia sp.]|nr:single-stranded DNA-binding protein [Candidatus Egerieousia sp.]HPT05881.1 single-stranded DNA-binding protein [Candidatus Egerieousia sp.]
MSVNKVILLGNVGKDPEVRHLESGASVANFTLATSERFKDRSGAAQEKTEWHNVVCWRALADIVEKYVKKGTQVYIEGKIRTRNYTDQNNQTRYVTEIYADSLQLVGRKSDNPASQGGYVPQHTTPAPQPQQPQTPINQDFPGENDTTDDLPF